MLILGSGLECFEQLLEDMLTLTNQWSICIDNISLQINFPKADNIILDIQGKKRHLAAYGRSAQWNIVKKKLTKGSLKIPKPAACVKSPFFCRERCTMQKALVTQRVAPHNFEANWVYLSLSLSANLLSLKHFKTMTITNSLTVL